MTNVKNSKYGAPLVPPGYKPDENCKKVVIWDSRSSDGYVLDQNRNLQVAINQAASHPYLPGPLRIILKSEQYLEYLELEKWSKKLLISRVFCFLNNSGIFNNTVLMVYCANCSWSNKVVNSIYLYGMLKLIPCI